MVRTRSGAKKLRERHKSEPQMAVEFEKPKQVHEEDERSVSPHILPLVSFPLEPQILPLSPQTPCLDLMDSAQNLHLGLVLGSSSVTLPLESTPPLSAQENASSGAIVLYKHLLKTETRYRWKRASPLTRYWNKKKFEILSQHFNPIPFSPKKWPLDISTHQILLTRLGLWDFLNLDFDLKIRTDLIKELVVCYNPKRDYYCRSLLHGMPITLSRAALANALVLPEKRFNLKAKGDGGYGNFVVSREEASFLEELIWGCLVLKDDDSEAVDDYVLKFTGSMKEMRYEGIDWAGLIWFMVERELSKGKNLVNCYYASHLQLLLKHQRPKLFDDHVDDVGSTGIETDAGDVKMLELENVLLDEKLKRESCDNGNDTFGLEGTENEQKKGNILVMCRKRRGEYFDKRMRERNLFIEENSMLSEGEKLSKQQSGADLGEKRFVVEQQMQDDNQDQHQPVLLYEGEHENESRCLTNLRCVGMDRQFDLTWRVGGTGEALECSTFMDSMMNQENHEEGLKDERSLDLMCSGMDDLNIEEMKNQPSDLISDEQNRETSFSLGGSGDKVEHAVAGKVSISDEQFDTNMEHCSKELIVVHCEKEDEAMEVLVNGTECKSEAVDSLDTTEEASIMVTNPVLDLNTEKHTTDNDISLNEEANRERHVYGSSNSGEGKVEPKVSHVNDFQNGVGVESMQVTLNALHGNVGSDYVEERKEEEVIDLDCRGLRLVDCKKEEDVKEDRANETECEANTGNLLAVHCEKEDVMEDKGNEAECEANTGDLLEVYCEKEDVEDKGNEAECEANTGDLLEVHCEKEDVMEDKGNETECEANTGDLLEVHCEKEDVMEDKGNEAECEANICNLLEVHCEKEDDVMEHEAVCVANIGNSLEVHCEKEDDVMEDEASEAECEADVGNSLEKEPQNVQDQDPLELQFKNESKKKRSSLNDLGCNEMDYQEVDLNCTRGNTVKELESSTSMDLMTYESHEKGLIREGSTALVFGGMDGLDEKEMDYQHVHFVSHQENTAKNFSLESTGEEDEHVMDQKIHTPDDRVAMDVDHCDNEMMLMQSEKEEDVMKTLPIEVACEGKLGNLPENKEKEFHKVGFVADMHNACSDEYDDGSKVLDFCAGQVEVWMARLKDAARRKVQSDSEINRKLLEKLEEQSQTIQRYETMRQKEQQQKQKDVRKYERELYLMKNVLQDYKKALKAVHNSFARYRERCQLPDESVYMDHPSGGGRLILVAKWKKLEQKRVIKAMVKKFEQDWVGKLEGHLENFDSFCDKLEDLEFAVRKLKEKAEATGYGTQKASHV